MEYSIREIFQMVAEKKISKENAMILIDELKKQQSNADAKDMNPDDLTHICDENTDEDTDEDTNNAALGDFKSVRTGIAEIVQNILHLSKDEINYETSFKDLGTDSISGVEIIRDINKLYKLNFDAVELYNYPTISQLAEKVYKEYMSIQSSVNDVNNADNSNLDRETHYDHEFLNPHFFEIRQKFINEEGNSERQERQGGNVEKKKVLLKLNETNEQANHNLPITAEKDIAKHIRDIVKNILHLDDNEIDDKTSFKDLGTDSISGVEIVQEINKVFHLNLDAVILYNYFNISQLSAYVNEEKQKISDSFSDIKTEQTDAAKEEHYDHEFLDPYFFEMRQKFIEEEPTQISNQRMEKTGPAETKKQGKMITLKSRTVQEEVRNIDNIPKHEHGKTEEQQGKDRQRAQQDFVAVIGMSGRFPGAENIEEYWSNIKNGIDSVTEIPKDRWDVEQYYSLDPKEQNKTYCRWMGALKDVDKFDPLFFNISPNEAESMDPQQRIFLEEAWKALEDAGYSDLELSNLKCGVFVGAARSDYEKKMEKLQSNNSAEAFTGLATSILPARISYFLNLKGPSIAIDTACSSSLVAVNMAALSILNHESDMAIAGGVRLMLTPDLQIQTGKVGMLSHKGGCRAFDKDADGIVMGEGIGVVVLKSYKKALEDHDHIYGIIRSFGMNQDGRTNGIMAPCEQSQVDLETQVYQSGNINPANITIVETHGTGTQLGDPIEVNALKTTFAKYTNEVGYCSLGSVKSNIGHTTMASGVASLIKMLLCMKYKMIPPQIHFTELNEHISLENSPFYINRELKEWNRKDGMPRQCAISSFGFSGTNCHIVVEEAPEI